MSRLKHTHAISLVGLSAALALTAFACSDDAETTSGTATTTGTSTGSSSQSSGAGGMTASVTGTNSSSSTAAGGAGTGGSGSGASGGAGGGSATTIRFVALGDGGEGNMRQAAVASAVKTVCDDRGGCAFALYLGDNIYDTGVTSANDQQFIDKFETPYQMLNFPFYVTLGNHDYGGGGAGFQFMRGQHQVDYSAMSTKWRLPGLHYNVVEGPIELFSLDTNSAMYGSLSPNTSAHEAWIGPALAGSTSQWKIAFGHHTFISNGRHGNAGEYEGLPFLPIANGEGVEDFINDNICGNVDVYFAGHDHNRQWLEPTCGTQFIVSGTAAKSTGLEGRGTPTKFEDDVDGGFFLAEITGNTFVGTFFDENAVEEFTHTFTK